MKDASSIEILVGILSVIIFLYRLIVIMVPMAHDGFREKNYSKIMNSLTLLV